MRLFVAALLALAAAAAVGPASAASSRLLVRSKADPAAGPVTETDLEAWQLAMQQYSGGAPRVTDKLRMERARKMETGRVEADTVCDQCAHFLMTVVKKVKERNLNKYDTVVAAQTECWQGTSARALELNCGSYNDMSQWLEETKLLRPSATDDTGVSAVDLSLAELDPVPFCARVRLCGLDETDHIRPHAAVVKLQLLTSLDLPPSHTRFPKFVQGFINDVANMLGISHSRLELHLHAGDETHPELVIRDPRHSDDPVTNPNSDAAKLSAGLDALEVARNFRDMVAVKHAALFLNHHFRTLIDTSFTPVVYQLRLPPVLGRKESKISQAEVKAQQEEESAAAQS